MHNRFSFKDFVVIVLLLLAVLLTAGAIINMDRVHDQVRGLREEVGELDRRVREISSKPAAPAQAGASALANPTPGTTAAGPGPAPATAPGAVAAKGDESWARPGVPVEWQPPPGFATDP